jgi:hypothetical protein
MSNCCGWNLARFDARSALSLIREEDFDLPFIIVSGTVGDRALSVVRVSEADPTRQSVGHVLFCTRRGRPFSVDS